MGLDDDTPRSLERYRDYLLLLARAQLAENARAMIDPSDVVQQTLLKAHERLNQFRGTSHAEMAGWLRTMLAHQIVDAARRLGRGVEGLARSIEDKIGESSARLEAWLASDDPPTDEQMLREEQLLGLARALGSLPDDQREALELRHLQGLSVPEIAACTGRTTAGVAGLLRRGLAKLRDLLDDPP